MNTEIVKQLEQLINQNDQLLKIAAASAKRMVDEYWSVWNARNKEISQESYMSGDRFKPGRFAPVISKIGSSKKITVQWKDFSPRFKGQRNTHGTVVKPKLGGYSVSCFHHALDWEISLILKTEESFVPLRELLTEMHKRLLADTKRLEKLKRLL